MNLLTAKLNELLGKNKDVGMDMDIDENNTLEVPLKRKSARKSLSSTSASTNAKTSSSFDDGEVEFNMPNKKKVSNSFLLSTVIIFLHLYLYLFIYFYFQAKSSESELSMVAADETSQYDQTIALISANRSKSKSNSNSNSTKSVKKTEIIDKKVPDIESYDDGEVVFNKKSDDSSRTVPKEPRVGSKKTNVFDDGEVVFTKKTTTKTNTRNKKRKSLE